MQTHALTTTIHPKEFSTKIQFEKGHLERAAIVYYTLDTTSVKSDAFEVFLGKKKNN